jgi:hypothetical protein
MGDVSMEDARARRRRRSPKPEGIRHGSGSGSVEVGCTGSDGDGWGRTGWEETLNSRSFGRMWFVEWGRFIGRRGGEEGFGDPV